MSRRRKIVVSVLAVLVLAVAGIGWYLNPIAPIATGYGAKNACSGELLAGRDPDSVALDLPDNPLVPFLRTSVDHGAETARSSLLGLWPTTAFFTEGLGCTLAEERPDFDPLPPLDRPENARWPDGSEVDATPRGADEALIDAALDGAFAEDDPEGRPKNTRAVVVVHDGRLIAERYAEGFGPGTPQLGWSMTKSVANAMVGRLVQQGRLAVDDADLMPIWREDPDDPRRQITVEHLMTMTDGLEFDETYEPGSDVTRMLFRPGDNGAYAADKPLVADPGTRWEYSSGSTNILCDVAVRASGGEGTTLARELVFEPLGMTTAVLEPDVSGDPLCSSYLYASARDWARFGLWFLKDGVWDGQALLPGDWVEYSTTPVEPSGDSAYGAGWWLNRAADGSLRHEALPADTFWASGHDGQRLTVVPSANLVVVRLGFTPALTAEEWGFEELIETLVEAAEAG